MRLYHSTYRDRADRILAYGFKVDAPRTSDPGDFGRACYFTAHRGRAAGWCPVLLSAEVTLDNPVEFEHSRAAYAWLDEIVDMIGWHTVRGSRWTRDLAAVALRQELMRRGHDGIVIHDPRGGECFEVAVFDESKISGVREESRERRMG